MGKNSTIKSLGRCIGNVVMHKLLLLYTNKPESKHHLNAEIIEYSADAFEKSQEFNWKNKDKEDIKHKSLARIKRLKEYYPDVLFRQEEAEKLILKTMKELLI